MNTQDDGRIRCLRCGAEFKPQTPGGVCPACAFGEALSAPSTEGGTSKLCLEDIPAPAGQGVVAKEGAADQAETILVSGLLEEKPGSRIGHYKLLQQIGEGGCGVVYMAEQEEPIRRRVAFKVIKLGMDTRQVIARFEAERQALALMDHPNIAKVLDAGATETGRPFFVMELVRGIRITDFCDQNNLSTEARLELFMQVCHAIQHAHQKGIIHRDIKPSNILVTSHDGKPVPKVIDFGIAKATQQRLTDKTLFTAFEQFIGTPAYMSPEQAEMSGLDIDTRSDIYALGVLLYELLTGKTPFDAKELVEAGLEGMRRIIREQEPARPSTRISTLGAEEQTTIARRRQVEVTKLIHQVRGDLDWIVMKCLEKDRTRRYETANGLAADLERHLGNEPVVARPPSTGYRVGKFVRRHKAKVAFALVVALAIVAAVLGQSVNLVRARRAEAAAKAATEEQKRLLELAEQAQAEAEIGRFRAQLNEQRAQVNARQAEAAASYLRNIFQAGLVRGDDTNFLGQFLDRASLNLANFGKNEPAAAAGFFSDLALSYQVIGQLGKAEASLREAVRFARQNATNNLPRLAGILLDLASHLQNPELASPERQLEANQLTREAMELLNRVRFSSRDMDLALGQLDYVARRKRFRDRKDELQFYRQWLDLIQNLQGNNARSRVGGVQSQLRRLLLEVGPIDEALAAIREQVKFNTAAWGRTNGPWAVITLESKLALAQALHDHNDLAEAETVYREVVADSSEDKRDPGHLAAAASSYSTFLSAAGRYPDAERVLLNAWDQVQRQDPAAPGAEWRHSVAQYLASFYEHWDNAAPQAGKAAKAAEWKAKQSQLAGPVSPAAPQADWTEFWNLNVYREPDKAAEWLQQHPEVVSLSPTEAGNEYERLAQAYTDLAKHDRAETMQREALRLCRKALTNNPSALADKVLGLALVLTHQNRSNEVEQLAAEALNLIGREPSPFWDTGKALTRLQMLAGEKTRNDPQGALRIYRQGAELIRRLPLLKEYLSGLLVDFVTGTRVQLVQLGRWNEAEPAAREAVELTAKVYGATNCLGARMELAGVLEHLDKLAEAEALYRQVAAGLVPLANDAPGEFNRFISGQGRYRPLDNDPFGKLSHLLLAQGRRAEAEQALLDGWGKLQAYPRTTAQQTCEAGQRVLEFYEAWDATAPAAGKAAKVALWKQKLAAFDRALADAAP